MKLLIAGLLFASITSSQADQAIAKAQQVLKDEGFYYGEVTGEKDADTSASIRRYQIRYGLEITGELDDKTLESLRKAPPATPAPAATTAPPVTQATPPAPPTESPDQQTENSGERDSAKPAPVQPFGTPPPQDREPPNVYPGRSVPSSSGGMFQGTPFETASPDVQRKVVADAQRALARQSLFKYQVDGVLSPEMEFSLRAYQARVGLRPTGRLDLETLAALELLPGAHERVYTPRRSLPPGGLPPVRGEWIRP